MIRQALTLGQTGTLSVLAGAASVTLFAASSLVQRLPLWNSGVILYTGSRVTQGKLRYRDVWDDKLLLISSLMRWEFGQSANEANHGRG